MLDACCLDGRLGLVDARLDLGREGMISFRFRMGGQMEFRVVMQLTQRVELEGIWGSGDEQHSQ